MTPRSAIWIRVPFDIEEPTEENNEAACCPSNPSPPAGNSEGTIDDKNEEYDEVPQVVFVQLYNSTKAEVTNLKETTNAFTRDLFPDDHFWKAPLLFTSGDRSSQVIRTSNAVIPRNPSDDEKYAVEYLYLGLDPTIRSVVENALSQKGMRATLDDEKFSITDERVWVTVNSINEKILVKDQDGQVEADVGAILEETCGGIIVDAYLSVDVKARSTDTTLNQEADISVKVNLICAYLKDYDVDTLKPELESLPNKRINEEDLAE